jgi:hypothetical protein
MLAEGQRGVSRRDTPADRQEDRQMSHQRATQNWIRRSALGAALAVAFLSGVAFASDDKLDAAHAALTKAVSALKDAQGQGPQFEEHRKKAIDLVTRAQGEVVKAKSP